MADSKKVLDRRGSARVGFGASVEFCEFSNSPSDFRPVKASDLSQTGISFVTTDWPSKDRLILRFGDNERQAVAQVVNVRCENFDEEDRRFEVSCQFKEWLAS